MNLRFRDFGRPIAVRRRSLHDHYPDLQSAWINYYDKDDLIGFPLRKLNPAYRRAVSADREVNVGNLLTSWNPLSHTAYLDDQDVIRPIAKSLTYW